MTKKAVDDVKPPKRWQTRSTTIKIPVNVRSNIQSNFQTARNIVEPGTVRPRRATKIHPKAAKYIPLFNYLAFDFMIVVILGIISATEWVNWAFLAYGILVVVFRTDSQRVFSAALISLVIIPAATIAKREEVADSFAVMTFYFLVIGLVRAVFELRRDSKR